MACEASCTKVSGRPTRTQLSVEDKLNIRRTHDSSTCRRHSSLDLSALQSCLSLQCWYRLTLATHTPWQPNRRRLPGRTADDDGDDDEEEEDGD